MRPTSYMIDMGWGWGSAPGCRLSLRMLEAPGRRSCERQADNESSMKTDNTKTIEVKIQEANRQLCCGIQRDFKCSCVENKLKKIGQRHWISLSCEEKL